MNLWADFLTNDQRTIHKWKHYFPAYEQHFGRFVYRPVVFWEIGCGKGGSLQMWKRYFGPHAQIIGLDIRPECRAFEEDQIAVRIGDQAQKGFLDSVLNEFGPPDAVLDDGSHKMDDIAATFRHLYPRLDRNGVYMVEDLHTAYMERYGGGLRREGTFIEICKTLIDELNGVHARIASDFTRSTMSMHFYDSIVVFERGKHGGRKALKTPQPTGDG
ncbi:MAG TPA: class I SAM-dependent methyltransferase [Rhizomicrobium sp.]|nr:class I SAM-dependent methyltransferase [Rhizomicrobium sp.]